jgi:hypothetical protein
VFTLHFAPIYAFLPARRCWRGLYRLRHQQSVNLCLFSYLTLAVSRSYVCPVDLTLCSTLPPYLPTYLPPSLERLQTLATAHRRTLRVDARAACAACEGVGFCVRARACGYVVKGHVLAPNYQATYASHINYVSSFALSLSPSIYLSLYLSLSLCKLLYLKMLRHPFRMYVYFIIFTHSHACYRLSYSC